jgi:hypothetical protein
MKVRLVVDYDCRKPKNNIVGETDIPDFELMPKILVFGIRTFIHIDTQDNVEIYEEAFAYCLPSSVKLDI